MATALAPHHFCLSWNGHLKHMSRMFEHLLMEEAFVDVTLACEGSLIKAHKTVLSASSPYFKRIFTSNPCSHPVIVLKDITYEDMMAVVNFMYRGKVNAPKDRFPALLDIAKTLDIVGLTEAVNLVNAQWLPKETSNAKRSQDDGQQMTKRRRRASQQSGGTSGDDEEAQPTSCSAAPATDALKIVSVESLNADQPIKDEFVIKHFEDQIELHPSIASQQDLTEESGSSFHSAENAQACALEGLIAELRLQFESMVNEITCLKRFSNIYLSQEKYDQILEDLKRINAHGPRCHSDYYKRRRFQIEVVDGVERLIKVKTGQVFVSQPELFDIIHRTHIILGHAGRDALRSCLLKSFANITKEVIQAYLNLCKECQKKHGGTFRHSEVTRTSQVED